MAQPEDDRARAVRSCLDSADDRRRNARHIREHAARPNLDPQTRAEMLRAASACDQQANWWEAGAEDVGADAPAFPRRT